MEPAETVARPSGGLGRLGCRVRGLDYRVEHLASEAWGSGFMECAPQNTFTLESLRDKQP